MATLVTCIVTGVTWCFCTAAASLLSSCCGNDKPSTVPPSVTSGRKRSVLLLIMAIIIALVFQYAVAPRVTDITIGNYVTDAWTDGCNQETQGLRDRCAGNSGVYRASASATLFFVLAAIAATLKPTANREAWPAKYVLFIFLCLATCFIPNDPLFSAIYLNIARIGGIFFIFLEQIVLIDLAYNWNDSWVTKSNQAEAEEPGSGKKWLVAILVSCAIFFIVSIIGIALLFHFFLGCATNTAFISVTLVMCVLIVAAQLSGDEGSLLGSAIIVLWAVFLCYTAVSKNPDGECNPQLGEDNVLGIVVGLGFAFVSLGWTGWSYTAETRLDKPGDSTEENLSSQDHQTPPTEDRKVTGVVANDYGSGRDEEAGQEDGTTEEEPKGGLSNSWKLNIILALISCWFAMALTGWGSIQSGGNASNPSVGRASMWVVIGSQWLVMSLYLWTLVAPRLFPDRDFS